MSAGRTCPHSRCAELNDRDAVICTTCGTSLVPDRRTLERWMRVRAAVQLTSAEVDADEHATAIVNDIERRAGAQPWPAPKEAA